MKKSSYIGPKLSRYQFEGLQNKGWIIEYASEVYRRRPNVVARLELELDSRFQDVVVKCFGWRKALNPFISSFFKSKAEKVWETSHRFLELGIPVPKPVAMYTERQGGFVNHNIFISEYVGKHQTGGHFLKGAPVSFLQKCEFIRKVAEIVAVVHRAGFLHHDLNPDNFLIANDNHNAVFLLDLTLVKYHKRLSIKERMHDIARLNLCDCQLDDDHEDCLWLYFLLHYDSENANHLVAPLKRSLLTFPKPEK